MTRDSIPVWCSTRCTRSIFRSSSISQRRFHLTPGARTGTVVVAGYPEPTRRWCSRWITVGAGASILPRRSTIATRAFSGFRKRAAISAEIQTGSSDGNSGREPGDSHNTTSEEAGIGNRIQLQVLNGLSADLRPQHMESSDLVPAECDRLFPERRRFATLQSSGMHRSSTMTRKSHRYWQRIFPDCRRRSSSAPNLTRCDDSPLYAAKFRAAGVTVWEKCFPDNSTV